jgi:hypothetical protein
VVACINKVTRARKAQIKVMQQERDAAARAFTNTLAFSHKPHRLPGKREA